MANFLYFARVRERMGRGREEIALPDGIGTVESMMAFLRQQGEPYASALAGEHLRVAVNQNYARSGDPVGNGDEIAIFPPVSGG